MKYCELDRPTDDILTVLMSIAKIRHCTQIYGNKKGYDLTGAALHFINEINKGTFGMIFKKDNSFKTNEIYFFRTNNI